MVHNARQYVVSFVGPLSGSRVPRLSGFLENIHESTLIEFLNKHGEFEGIFSTEFFNVALRFFV
jgi:hypothetical protein